MAENKFWLYALRHAENPLDAITLYRCARRLYSSTPDMKGTQFNFRINGERLSIFLRKGTTDVGTFLEVFCHEIYKIPKGLKPKVIVDIGGNIGMVSLFLSKLFPEASIHTFEPIPANLEIMRQNVEVNGLSNVTIHPYGLGDQDEELVLSAPTAGAFWCYSTGHNSDGANSVRVPIRNIRAVLDELGLQHIDLMKVDCEGAEVAIFQALGERLSQVDVLLGELHPNFANCCEALYLLSKSHQVDFKKDFNDAAFPFRAAKDKAYLTDFA